MTSDGLPHQVLDRSELLTLVHDLFKRSQFELFGTFRKLLGYSGGVEQQVSHLFKSHTDLLSEFSQFLPDEAAGVGPAQGTLEAPRPPTEALSEVCDVLR